MISFVVDLVAAGLILGVAWLTWDALRGIFF